MTWSRIRRATQLLTFAVFAVVTLGGLGLAGWWLPANLFSRLDPLVGLAAALASRSLVIFWAAALLTLALTVAFGRVWCGWLCPLGTVVELVPGRKRAGKKSLPGWVRMGKYVTLAVVVGAAALGSLGPMVLDPLTIIMRPIEEIARPLVGTNAVAASAGVFVARGVIAEVAFLSLVPLILVLALNAIDRRFWCRNLCPLGGLLGLVSLLPGLRRTVDVETCTSCARCAKTCPTQAVDRSDAFSSSSAECIACMQCIDTCPTHANGYRPAAGLLTPPAYQPRRRQAVVATGVSVAGLALAVLPVEQIPSATLRPPSTDEKRLSELCVRCGQCYGQCPTGVLHPDVSFTTLAGPWTPMLDERPAHCTLNCNKCAKVCPTDALHTPTPAERVALGLGAVAAVDKQQCRAWGRNHDCMLCQTACPIAGALVSIDRPAGLPGRPGPSVQVPVVDAGKCVGCNQCRGVCPMMPPAVGTHVGTETSPQPRPATMPAQ
jgi:polyferredoxin